MQTNNIQMSLFLCIFNLFLKVLLLLLLLNYYIFII